MPAFQMVSLILAIIALIICLILIATFLQNSKNSQEWPPAVQDCPDWWEDLSGGGSKCSNTKNLGKCKGAAGIVDFTADIYKGSTGACAKYNWAKNCGVEWDGVTYGVPNPCLKKTS